MLWNTRYMNAALDQLRARGSLVLDEDVARLSPFARDHLNVGGKPSKPERGNGLVGRAGWSGLVTACADWVAVW